MPERAKARAARLLIQPPEEAKGAPEATGLSALTAETVGEGLQALRHESGLETPEVLARRGLTKGRLSQLERRTVNPHLSTITQQADALEYDVTIVFTPRHKDRRAVRVALKPASTHCPPPIRSRK